MGLLRQVLAPSYRLADDVTAPAALRCESCGIKDAAPLVMGYGPQHGAADGGGMLSVTCSCRSLVSKVLLEAMTEKMMQRMSWRVREGAEREQEEGLGR